ncbi:MAG: hypothetical protein N2Z65_00665 [Clostridiales bacterium]|nr:hypothetical protein [Clostridiales bacterium]
MAVNSTNNSIYFNSTKSTSDSSSIKKDKSSLSLDDFLKILSAELQNQSMDNTVDNSQMITQMAQFSTITSMQELSAATSKSYAVSLIGKTVNIVTTDANGKSKTVTGTVDKVNFEDGVPYLSVDGTDYETSDVTNITPTQVSDTETNKSYAVSLIGKTVNILTTENGTSKTVTGTVDKVNLKDGVPYLSVNGTDYETSDVTSIVT